jgi:hypothetical protein
MVANHPERRRKEARRIPELWRVSEEFTAPGFEDPYLWLRIREQGEFEYVDEPLVSYRATSPLERMLKYTAGYKIFARLVKHRYGTAGERLIRECSISFAYAWSYEGARALCVGDKLHARRAFECAVRYGPPEFRFRATSRWLRTFLPLSMVRALSGKLLRRLRRTETPNEGDHFLQRPSRILFH